MPLYEFCCPDGHRYEALRPRSTEVESCACGLPASRMSVYKFGFTGFASTPQGQSDFHEEYRRFEEASATIDDKVSKRERDSGEQISVPLYRAAKERADKLAKLGVTADQIST